MTLVQKVTAVSATSLLALLLCACASTTRPAGAERPRADAPPRFAVLTASDERRAAALANWATVVGEQGAAASPTPELSPVTATLTTLPAGLNESPRLPLVRIGDEKTGTEEETRESLRRFLAASAPLLGVEMKQLSLVRIADAPAGAGARRAVYRQHPFAYPLRNGYGTVAVTFTPDMRVVGLSSTAVPDAEGLDRTLAQVPKTLTAEQAAAALANRTVTFTDRAGAQQTRTVAQVEASAVRQLVVFPLRRDADPASLELHVAWEVALGGPESTLFAYVDVATGDVLGAEERTREGR
jgi:hypothetical protein